MRLTSSRGCAAQKGSRPYTKKRAAACWMRPLVGRGWRWDSALDDLQRVERRLRAEGGEAGAARAARCVFDVRHGLVSDPALDPVADDPDAQRVGGVGPQPGAREFARARVRQLLPLTVDHLAQNDAVFARHPEQIEVVLVLEPEHEARPAD